MNRDRVQAGELWRLISSGFMHANAEHLIGNLVMLFDRGDGLRARVRPRPVPVPLSGRLRVGLVAGDGRRRSPMVGASGAILGLAGSLITMIRLASNEDRAPRPSSQHRPGRMGDLYLVSRGLQIPSSRTYAHLGGLLGGSILGFLLGPVILDGRRRDWLTGCYPKLETGCRHPRAGSGRLVLPAAPSLRSCVLISPSARV